MTDYDIVNSNSKAISFCAGKAAPKTKFSDSLKEITNKVKERILNEVHDTGYFRSFAEDLPIKNRKIYGSSVSLCVERDETADGCAQLLVSVLHPVLKRKEASEMLVCGNRKTLMDYISKDNFNEEFEKTVLELAESLKELG